MTRELTDAEFERYARHLILDEVGDDGQDRLLASRVLVVGAGGLGAPVLMYLAAAGVGTLGIVDDDIVDLSNLQRQIVHDTDAVGRPKVASAKESLAHINPGVAVETFETRLDAESAPDLFGGWDLIVDGSDNFPTRYAVNDAAIRAGKTVVSGAILRFEGQVTTIRAGVDSKAPCWRCLFPEAPPPELVPRCEEAGILGAIAGVVGSLQATEALKELLGLGEPLAGRLLLYDALSVTLRTINYPKAPGCKGCGGG